MINHDITVIELSLEEALTHCRAGKQVFIYNSAFELFYKICETERALKNAVRVVSNVLLPHIKYLSFVL